MEDKIRFAVVTSGGTVFEKQVSYVNIPTDFGSVGILKGHAPMLCAVGKGVARCSFGDGESAFIEVDGGVANVADNEVTLLASSAKLRE